MPRISQCSARLPPLISMGAPGVLLGQDHLNVVCQRAPNVRFSVFI